MNSPLMSYFVRAFTQKRAVVVQAIVQTCQSQQYTTLQLRLAAQHCSQELEVKTIAAIGVSSGRGELL